MRSSDVVDGHGRAFRLGGDEFCLLLDDGTSDALFVDAARALEARGDGFDVTASYGVVRLPADADTPEEALHLADRRMYAAKEARPSSAGLQTRTVLLKVLSEREPDLHEHSSDVMALARGVARRLGLPVEERDIVARAAELHDIGKMAIPDAILNKPGPLDDREWRFMRRHTIIGEDILNVAPALQPVAALVRASHERWDGKGYPDGTSGDEIPRGARIVAVCDAFSAMVQDRPYQAGLSVNEAVVGDQAVRGHELRPRGGRGVRRRDPLRSGDGVRRSLAAGLLALACSAAAPAAKAAPGDLAVADEGNLFGSTGRLVTVTPAGAADVLVAGAPLRNPWAVAVAPDGAMLLADEGAESIFRITPAGAVTTVASGRELDDPVGIALAPGGVAYLSDRNRDAVLRVDLANGRITKVADVRDAAGLAFDRAGKLLVTDERAVRRVDPGTGAVTTAAEGAPLDRPLDVAVALDGTTFVVDGARVLRISPTGAKSVLASGAPLDDPNAIDIEPDGDLVVADRGGARDPRRPRHRRQVARHGRQRAAPAHGDRLGRRRGRRRQRRRQRRSEGPGRASASTASGGPGRRRRDTPGGGGTGTGGGTPVPGPGGTTVVRNPDGTFTVTKADGSVVTLPPGVTAGHLRHQGRRLRRPGVQGQAAPQRQALPRRPPRQGVHLGLDRDAHQVGADRVRAGHHLRAEAPHAEPHLPAQRARAATAPAAASTSRSRAATPRRAPPASTPCASAAGSGASG